MSSNLINPQWQKATVEALEFKKGKTMLIAAPRRTGRTRLLAMAFARARAAGIKGIKFIARSAEERRAFFETELPAAGLPFDLFYEVDSEALVLEECELVLVDDIDKQTPANNIWVADAAKKTEFALIATCTVLPDEPLTDAEKQALAPLAPLKKRYVRWALAGGE